MAVLMRTPLMLFFGGIAFAGMVPFAPVDESYWMITIGLVGCAVSFFLTRKDPT